MIIDVFNHYFPEEYLKAIPHPLPERITRLRSTIKGIDNLEYRLRLMDECGVDVQILSLPVPTLDDLSGVPTREFRQISRAGNDGIAKVVENSHGRFKGIATVSLLDVGDAVDEVERSVKDLGLLGVQILSNVRGRPLDLKDYDEFYSKVRQLDCGVWIHPANMRETYSWMNDEFNMNIMVGWGIDTSLAMIRMIRGGVLERHPGLKVIPHHLGVLIPLMAHRINRMTMGQGKGGLPPEPLKKTPMEYMKMFYVDTAEGMWKPAMLLSHGFFGSSHMLFGTDFPWGDVGGVIKNVNALEIPPEEKEMILSGNAIKLLRIQ